MKYRVFGNKPKSKYHLVDPKTGKSVCRAENNLMLGKAYDLTDIPENRGRCQLCSPPEKPKFLEAEGQNCILFIRGDRITTVGKKCPWFDEACAEIRKDA